jgi:hypothetical protein
MREIKFRAWDEVSESMIFWGELISIQNNLKLSALKGVTNLKWEQFTGLQDKNGVDIYHGDLAINAVGEKGIVKSEDGTFYLYYFDEPAKQYLHLSVIKDKDYNSTGKCDIEVIGNIRTIKL